MSIHLSILIPVYNRKNSITRILNNLAQDELSQHIEIIVSDNNSKDGTREFLKDFSDSKAVNNLKIVYQDSNLGPLENWRECIRNATGRYVHWYWSDDHVDQGFHSQALKNLKGEESVLLFPAYYAEFENNNLKILNPLYLPSKRDRFLPVSKLLARKLGGRRLPVSPLAYILPARFCRKILLEFPIQDHSAIQIEKYATGYDDLMIIESLNSVTTAHLEQSKNCYMVRHGGSISMQESGKGNQTRYAYARLAWCKENKKFVFRSLFDILRLIYFRKFGALFKSLSY